MPGLQHNHGQAQLFESGPAAVDVTMGPLVRLAVVPGITLASIASGVSLGGLTSDRTRETTDRLLQVCGRPGCRPAGGRY